jgi:hypothetical protein
MKYATVGRSPEMLRRDPSIATTVTGSATDAAWSAAA